MNLAAIWNGLLGVVYPSDCLGCLGAIEEGNDFPHLCGSCGGKVKLIEEPHCLTCGYPFFGETENRPHCEHCEALDARFSEGRALTLLQGPARQLVYALKYGKQEFVRKDLRVLMLKTDWLAEYLGDAVLIPVPIHPRKFRERGFNQSEIIAEEILQVFGNEVDKSLLERVEDNQSQTTLDRTARRENVRNAFSTGGKAAIDPKIRHIIIDDVFTTGSTLNACAIALRRAGARRIDVLSIGHG